MSACSRWLQIQLYCTSAQTKRLPHKSGDLQWF